MERVGRSEKRGSVISGSQRSLGEMIEVVASGREKRNFFAIIWSLFSPGRQLKKKGWKKARIDSERGRKRETVTVSFDVSSFGFLFYPFHYSFFIIPSKNRKKSKKGGAAQIL